LYSLVVPHSYGSRSLFLYNSHLPDKAFLVIKYLIGPVLSQDIAKLAPVAESEVYNPLLQYQPVCLELTDRRSPFTEIAQENWGKLLCLRLRNPQPLLNVLIHLIPDPLIAFRLIVVILGHHSDTREKEK
jgi:hypothetical protein